MAPARNKKPNEERAPGEEGVQIDILVHRNGRLLSLIECKFRDDPIGPAVIHDVERKIKLLKPPRGYTVERILLSASGITPQLKQEGYFHRVIGLEALFDEPAC